MSPIYVRSSAKQQQGRNHDKFAASHLADTRRKSQHPISFREPSIVGENTPARPKRRSTKSQLLQSILLYPINFWGEGIPNGAPPPPLLVLCVMPFSSPVRRAGAIDENSTPRKKEREAPFPPESWHAFAGVQEIPASTLFCF